MPIEYLLVPSISGQPSVRAISAALEALPGVLLVSVSPSDKRVRVEHDGRANLASILAAIRAAGHPDAAVLA